MNFGAALEVLKSGGQVTRPDWEDVWLDLFYLDTQKSMSYIRLKTIHGDHVPWSPNHIDLLADDWVEVMK